MSTSRSPSPLELVIHSHENEEISEATPLLTTSSTHLHPEPVQQTGLFARFWLPILIFVAAFLAASTNFINGLVIPTKSASKDILNPEWWKKLSQNKGTLIHSILNAISGLSVNTLVNRLFFPKAFKGIVDDFKGFRSHPARAITALAFALVGAVGSFAVAFTAYSWFPEASWGGFFAGGLALTNIAAYIATRHVSVKGLLTRSYNFLFSEDFNTQHDFVEMVTHINSDHKEVIQGTYARILGEKLGHHPESTPVTQTEIESIMVALAEEIQAYMDQHPDCLYSPTKSEKLVSALRMFVDITVAVAVGVPGFATFLQKGFDGFASFAPLADTNIWLKRLIGLAPALSSAAVYAPAGFDFTSKTIQFVKYLRQHPTAKNIMISALILPALGLSTSNMQAVSQGILSRKDNILFVGENTAGLLLVIGASMAGGMINTNSALGQIFLSENPTRKELEQLDHLADYLNRAHDHPIKSTNAHQLRNLPFFSDRSDRRNAMVPETEEPTYSPV